MKENRFIHTAVSVLSGILFTFSTTACTGVQQKTDSAAPPSPTASSQTFVFECPDGTTFTAKIEDTDAWLFLPRKTERLKVVPSASGVKYSHKAMLFWMKGEESLLQVGDEIHKGCKNNRSKAIWEDAKLRGVDFRARGNEPGWHLEITSGRQILFVSDYGNSRYSFSARKPDIDRTARTTTYSVKDTHHTMTVVIGEGPCNDTMSDESFEATVTVSLDNKRHRGCGKALH